MAGEASADQHGAGVVQQLKARSPNTDIFGVGGSAMVRAGFDAVVNAESMAVAGLTEVITHVPRLVMMMRRLLRLCARKRPQVALLIDMPDFNLPLAKRLDSMGIAVIYYISPQLWAWRARRIEIIRRHVKRMLVILPFETEFYDKHGVEATFVGHPLVEQTQRSKAKALGLKTNDPDQERQAAQKQLGLGQAMTLALLPGSRNKEVSRHLPIMLDALRLLRQEFPHLQAILPIASTIKDSTIHNAVKNACVPIRVINQDSALALLACDVAAICSGTATLQAALLRRPMVVVYKLSALSFFILKRLVKVRWIALVNLIAQKQLVPELVQSNLSPKALAKSLRALFVSAQHRKEIQAQLGRLALGLRADKAASVVCDVLEHHITLARTDATCHDDTSAAQKTSRRAHGTCRQIAP